MAPSFEAQKLLLAHLGKKMVVDLTLVALASAFELVSKRDPKLKAEIADWEEGRTFALGIYPDGPAVTMKKTGDRIVYVGKGFLNPKLKMLFKNIDSAFLPFTGQMGAHTAFCQHRVLLHGSIGEAMQATRALGIVQTFLLPDAILRKAYKDPPKLSPSEKRLKALVMGEITFKLLANLRK